MADGRAGAPLGNTNGSKGRPWTDALRRALAIRSKLQQRPALDDLAEKLLQAADNKEQWAFTELANRIEGKVKDNDDQAYKVIVIRQLESQPANIIDITPEGQDALDGQAGPLDAIVDAAPSTIEPPVMP